jgi:hypothetical protein
VFGRRTVPMIGLHLATPVRATLPPLRMMDHPQVETDEHSVATPSG